MKAFVLVEFEKSIYKDDSEPEISQDNVLSRIKECGICGFDVHVMDGSTSRRIPHLIMGHEASGVYTET